MIVPEFLYTVCAPISHGARQLRSAKARLEFYFHHLREEGWNKKKNGRTEFSV